MFETVACHPTQTFTRYEYISNITPFRYSIRFSLCWRRFELGPCSDDLHGITVEQSSSQGYYTTLLHFHVQLSFRGSESITSPRQSYICAPSPFPDMPSTWPSAKQACFAPDHPYANHESFPRPQLNIVGKNELDYLVASISLGSCFAISTNDASMR